MEPAPLLPSAGRNKFAVVLDETQLEVEESFDCFKIHRMKELIQLRENCRRSNKSLLQRNGMVPLDNQVPWGQLVYLM